MTRDDGGQRIERSGLGRAEGWEEWTGECRWIARFAALRLGGGGLLGNGSQTETL